MDILEIIGRRRSIRKFKPDPISENELTTILKAGHTAPSACNMQNWRFIVINDNDLKQKLSDIGAASFIKHAPVGILVLYDNRTQNVEYSDHIQSGAAAIQNMLLAASALGIGACWVCHLPPKKLLKKLMSIPWHMTPIAYITLGYPVTPPLDRPRKEKIENLISYNRYAFDEPLPKRSIGLYLRIILIKIYYLLPMKLKNILFPFVDKNLVKKFE